jgi:hypothetical protein
MQVLLLPTDHLISLANPYPQEKKGTKKKAKRTRQIMEVAEHLLHELGNFTLFFPLSPPR